MRLPYGQGFSGLAERPEDNGVQGPVLWAVESVFWRGDAMNIDRTPPRSWWDAWRAAMSEGSLARCGVAFDRLAAEALRLLALSHYRRGFTPEGSASLCLVAYCPEVGEKIRTEEPEEGKTKAPQGRGSLA